MKQYFFIRRPILAIAIALMIICCGIVAAFNISVSQFPNISPPVIAVRAQFPGANAETAARVVAAQIENQLNGTSQLLYMATTTSATGSISINLTFEIGTDLNVAINEVLNRIYASMSLLPPIVQQVGVTARKSSPDQLLSVAFYADPYMDPKFISNYLQRTVQNDLLLLPTVGNISVYGTGTYAIRVWLDPNKMERYKISLNEIQTAIRDQNQEYVIGRANSPPFKDKTGSDKIAINLIGSQMFSTPEQVANIVLRNNRNQSILLKDIARVELGANNYTSKARINFREADGKFKSYPCSILQVYLVPGSNQLLAKKQVLNALEQDSKRFPFELHYRITNDNSRFVAASIRNVFDTLQIAIVLVVLVILLFLRNWRACLIVAATIPVSVLGTIACLYLLGYSLNTLSLFALILAIGIVVDDAIVIVENIERLKQENPDKSLIYNINQTMFEVKSAVIAIVLVLSVVFLPIMKLDGLSGVMYRQFAVTIACAVVISGISALTFVPALSAQLFDTAAVPNKSSSNYFNKILHRITDFYVQIAEYIILKRGFVILILLSVIVTTYSVFKIVPVDFVPLEDQGLIMASVNLPSSSSLEETESSVQDIMNKMTDNPNIASILSIVGVDFLDSGGQKPYAASFSVSLQDWSDRQGKHSSANAVIRQMNNLNKQMDGISIKAFNQPPMRGLSTTGGVEFYLEDRVTGDPRLLQSVGESLIQSIKKHKEVANAYQTLDTNTLQISLVPDIDMTKFYKVNLSDLYNMLQAMYSNNNVNYTYIMQGLVWVILEADYRYRATMDGLRNIYVRNANNDMVPAGSVLKVGYASNAQVIQRFNNYIASKITVIPAKGHTMGEAMQVIDVELTKIPKGYGYDWFGTSYQLKHSQKTSIIAFSVAFVMIYLVLAALFEMWRLPLVILMGVPFALFGAIIILLVSGLPNDLYFQISLIALLGLSAKNIILLVEFALQHYKSGYSPVNSAIHALRMRFRPILMTSVTFICGTLPLVFAHGAGANAEHSLGVGIIGGVIGSVFLATIFTPAYFVLIMHGYHRQK